MDTVSPELSAWDVSKFTAIYPRINISDRRTRPHYKSAVQVLVQGAGSSWCSVRVIAMLCCAYRCCETFLMMHAVYKLKSFG